MQVLPPLYPITPQRNSSEELFEWVKILLGEGCKLLQFRRKIHSDKQQLQELEKILCFADGFSCSVIVNDRCDLCAIAGAHGVHLGQSDISPFHARRLLGGEKIIGLSTHDALQASLAFKEQANYIALGPVFPTQSKENPDTVIPADVQREIVMSSPVPVVAIGGIIPSSAGQLWERGFASLAVISALEKTPAKAWRFFLSERDKFLGALC